MKALTPLLTAGALAAAAALAARRAPDDLHGEVAIVTGASRGLGLLLARELGRQGCPLVICARDSDELQQVRWSPSNYPGSLTRAQLVERYALATGRDVSSMTFYLAFARFKVAVILQQIYYRFHLGLTQDQRFASLPRKIETLLRASVDAAETGEI